MKDFILLFKSPSELYQKGREDVSIKVPMILYLLLGCLSIIVLYYGVESSPTVEALKMTAASSPVMLGVTMVSGLFGTLLGLFIMVQILYYVMILTCKVIDDVDFNKKQVKKLLYLAEILPAIPFSVLHIIVMLVTKAEVSLWLSTICGIVTSLFTCLMIGYTMKVSMGAKKAHIIYPGFVFAIGVITQIINFVSGK